MLPSATIPDFFPMRKSSKIRSWTQITIDGSAQATQSMTIKFTSSVMVMGIVTNNGLVMATDISRGLNVNANISIETLDKLVIVLI